VTAPEPGRSEVALVAADGRSASRVLTSDAEVLFLRWHLPSGRLLAAARWGRGQLEIRSVIGRSDVERMPVPFLPLPADPASALFDVSRNGRFAVDPRGVLEGDIWVLDAASRRY
jgi:hypothetical protein